MNKREQKAKQDRKLMIRAVKEAERRARSVTVGTAFGGTVELTMRQTSGEFTFAILQPVEVVELIHQMSASIGCHLQLKPRKDFSSWREWKEEHNTALGAGWPPFSNDLEPHHQVGANLPPPEQQPGMIKPEIRSTENVMATKKPKNQRSTQRTAKTA